MGINNILNFDITCLRTDSHIITETTKYTIERSLGKLNKILSISSDYQSIIASEAKVLILRDKIMSNKNIISVMNFKNSEIRLLSYVLDYFVNESQIFEALLIRIKENWCNSHIAGLTYYLIKNWGSANEQKIKVVSTLLFEKVAEYKGTRKSIVKFKKFVPYFRDINTPIRLGIHCFDNNIEPLEMSTILGFPRNWVIYKFFSGVILSYYKKASKDDVQTYVNIVSFLKEHTDLHTSKKLIPQMIIDADKFSNIEVIDIVKNIALERIGDPVIETNWLPDAGISVDEIQNLKNAQQILNGWISAQFVDLFFRECINDPRRKEFWMRYTHAVKNVRIFGSTIQKSNLLCDERLRPVMKERFSVVHNSNISALVMDIGEYRLIEFSDIGNAFYAYVIDSDNCPDISKEYSYINSLKRTHLDSLISGDYYRREGRLSHSGDWENRLKYWLRDNAKILQR